MKFSSLARHGLTWLLLALPMAAVAATPIFVNELHYDNAGDDVGEAVEVAGPAGTDLTGWSVVLYNGKHSDNVIKYDTLPLTGTITACSGMAYGVVVLTPPGGQIQNGPRDGLALVDAGGNVVQLLSYAGTFTATDGPAAGMTSTDIGLEEGSSTAIGESLQLTGDGSNYEDFTWTGPLADSFGSCNASQTFGTPVDVPPMVVSTAPLDSAIGVAIGSALTVNFSEPVTLAAGAITLECASSPQAGTLGGSADAWTFTPTAALPETASCTATVHAADVTDLDGTSNDPMDEDYTFSFQTTGDFAPAVLAFTPADNATDVAIDTAVAVQFSESVTLATGAISLSCGGTDQPGALSGSAADYIFTPTATLPYSAACVTTVTAADVADTDGSPTAMVSDASASFNTVADLPPSVSTTVPADNATAFPTDADLAVTFSEPVTLASSWYAIQCSDSGAHTAVQSGSVASYTLDPNDDLTPLETCTLTITAADVQDATANVMTADVVVSFTVAPSVADYYEGVDTSTGLALKAWLHTRVTTAPLPYNAIVAYPYTASTTDTWDILNQADQDPNNPANILDLYKNASLLKISGGQGSYNREHTWPKSLGFPADSLNNKPNPPYTDTHMLHLTEVTYNSARGNGPLGNCTTPDCTAMPTDANNGFGGTSDRGDSDWESNNFFEVWNHRKGDIARAVMYMVVRYQGGVDADGIQEPKLELTDDVSKIVITNAQTCQSSDPTCVAYNGLLSDLLEWNQQDPPDAQEELRNDLVFSHQHNRNPFVDHPEWAMCVFKNVDCAAANDVIFADGFEVSSGNE